jgi:CRP/FNR family transcriptional regulator
MTATIETLGAAYSGFLTLPPPLQAQVTRDLRGFRAERGQLLTALDDGCRVPFVLGGAVQIALPLPRGRFMPLYTLAQGDWCVMGVAHAVGQAPRPLLATAVDDAWGVTLAGRVVRTCLDAHRGLWSAAFAVVTARVVDLTDVVLRLAATTVDQRLASLLLARGPHVDATHQGLADELGTAREVVSRALEHFAAEGLVRLGRAHIEVADPRGLAEHQLPPGH